MKATFRADKPLGLPHPTIGRGEVETESSTSVEENVTARTEA